MFIVKGESPGSPGLQAYGSPISASTDRVVRGRVPLPIAGTSPAITQNRKPPRVGRNGFAGKARASRTVCVACGFPLRLRPRPEARVMRQKISHATTGARVVPSLLGGEVAGERIIEPLDVRFRRNRAKIQAGPLSTPANRERTRSRIETTWTGTGAPWWIRTTDPQLRRLLLYPTELRAQSQSARGRHSTPPGSRPSQLTCGCLDKSPAFSIFPPTAPSMTVR